MRTVGPTGAHTKQHYWWSWVGRPQKTTAAPGTAIRRVSLEGQVEDGQAMTTEMGEKHW